jgi:hypothetical protein
MLKPDNKFYDFLKAKEITGVFFGYPNCCIDFFLKRSERLLSGDTKGWASSLTPAQDNFTQGFIPCKKCAETVKPGKEGTLIKNRICSTPYPVEGDSLELEKFMLMYEDTDLIKEK